MASLRKAAILTYDHLGRWLRRQPEDHQGEYREEDTGKDEDVTVEGPDPLQADRECQVYVGLHTAWISLHIPEIK